MRRELPQALVAIVGREHVLDALEDREEYALDAFPLSKAREALGGATGPPDVVARPGSTPEVQAIVRLANDRRIPIVPYGGGTGVMGAAVPVQGGIVVDLRRMDRVLESDADGLTAQVEAGALLKDVDEALNQGGLMLGHDPWSQAIATVGGAISTDGVGYLAARYGSMGEQVLDLEVVLPNGELLPAKKVSMAAGPPLNRLLIGAEGTLGIITTATLRVFPLPERRTVHALAFTDFEAGYHAVLAMGRQDVHPSMVDYSQEPMERGEQSVLYMAFEGFKEEAEAHRARGLALCAQHGGWDLGEAEARRFWDTRHAVAEQWARRNAAGRRIGRSQAPAGPSWFDYLHVAVPPAEVLEYKGRCERILAEAGLQAREYAIWGRPDLFSVAVVGALGQETPPGDTAAVSRTLLKMAQELGGSMEYCHGVGLKLRGLMERELGAGAAALRSIKAALDPNNIMNPGKLGLPPMG